jgi:hypothetical protein
MKKLFVSYAREDTETVKSTVKDLQDLGYDVWIDSSNIVAGHQFSTAISQGIAECDFFLLFVSTNSIKSDFIRREVDVAHKKRRTIIQLLLEDVDIPNELDLQLAGIHWIQFSDSNWMSRLLVALGDSQSGRKLVQQHTNGSIEHYEPLSKSDSITDQFDKRVNVPQSVILILAYVVDIFERDFIYPKECDEAIIELRKLVNIRPFDREDIHLQYVFENQTSEIINQISEFRKICQAGTSQTENERKNILKNVNSLFRTL